MKKYILVVLVLAAVAMSTTKARSYVRSTVTSSNGSGIGWNLSNPHTTGVVNGKIQYEVNLAASKNVPFAQAEPAINAAFQAWQNISTASIAFNELPGSSLTTTGNDGHFPIFWLENSDVTSDGMVDVTGALAVTSVFRFTSGPNTGEIIDANMVFNGHDNTWTTTGAAGAFDIQEVATHEAGHSLGLDHSPLLSATMFPRTGADITKSQSLSIDDQIAASIIYPTAQFTSSTGKIGGLITDGGVTSIFGAHVVALDPNGIAIASTLSQPDGSYLIQGLNPGNYTIYAQPLNSSGGLFTSGNLGGFYSGINITFLTTGNLPVSVNAGATTTQNIIVSPTTPSLSLTFITKVGATLGNFTLGQSGTTVNQGGTQVLVGVAGPNVPATGTPLSISGVGPGLPSGITVGTEGFGTLSDPNHTPVVFTSIDLTSTAVPGPRDLIVTSGNQRTIAAGGLEIIGNNPLPATSSLSPSSATQGGQSFTLTVNGSNFVYGSTVQWNGSNRPTFFLSPTQLTATISGGDIAGSGTATVTVVAPTPGGGSSNPQSFSIGSSQQSQSITFNPIPTHTFGDASFTLTATASSGLPVTFSVISGQSFVSLSGNQVTILGAGNVTIQADQAGNASFSPAPPQQQSFTINKANQTINFSAIPNQTFGGAPFTIAATATSGLSVSFSVTVGPTLVSLNGNQVTILGAGSVTIQASQAGNANVNAATPVTQSFTINKANQTINFGPLANKTFGDAPFNLAATATSGEPVAFSVTAGATFVNLSGNSVTIVGAGSVTIQANQTGNANFNAAPGVPQSFTINKATATLSLSTPTQIADGSQKVSTVTTNPPGLTVVTITYNGSTTAPSAPGSYSIVASLNNANFQASNATGTMRIVNISPTNNVSVNPGSSGTASVLPTVPGITLNLTHTAGGAAATVTVGVFSGNPTDSPITDVGGGFCNGKITNPNAGDTSVLNYYYPNTITGSNETLLQLFYFNGTTWTPVKDVSGNPPTKVTTDNPDGTVSGGKFTVNLSSTSSPKVSDFANGNGLAFTISTVLSGDVSGDGQVTVSDLVILANIIAGNITPTASQKLAGDVFQDGQITIQDLVTLANFIAGNIHSLPVVPGAIADPGDPHPEPLSMLSTNSSISRFSKEQVQPAPLDLFEEAISDRRRTTFLFFK